MKREYAIIYRDMLNGWRLGFAFGELHYTNNDYISYPVSSGSCDRTIHILSTYYLDPKQRDGF
jgi:hypothetical protein